jgi:hypothetical protein
VHHGARVRGLAPLRGEHGPREQPAAALVGPGDRRHPTTVDDNASLRDVACPSTHVCVAVDNRGDALTTADPTAPSPRWASEQVAPRTTAFSSVTCPSTRLCVAVGNHGTAAVTTDPAAVAPKWSTNTLTHIKHVMALACPARTRCLVITAGREVFSLSDPKGGPPAWRNRPSVPGPLNLSVVSLSCASRSFCVAVDQDGDTVTSTDPLDPSPRWRYRRRALGIATTRYAPTAVQAISCPSTRLCVTAASGPDRPRSRPTRAHMRRPGGR